MEQLREEFLRELSGTLDYETTLEKRKEDEIRNTVFKFDDRKVYTCQIFNPCDIESVLAISPTIEFVKTPEQNDLWNFFKVHTSSISSSKSPFRNQRILVKDETSGKYLGIISISSDFMNCKIRDNAIGWSRECKTVRLQNVMHISTCIGLQPFAFNTNGGKLISALCFSKEILEYIENKYSESIVALTTMSINGKSIQYDRMTNFLKYIGLTEGKGGWMDDKQRIISKSSKHYRR